MRRIVLLLGALALFGAGFSAAVGADPLKKKPPKAKKKTTTKKPTTTKKATTTTTKKTTTTAKTSTTPTTPTGPTFPAGIYYERRDDEQPGVGTLRLLGGSLAATFTMTNNVGFDVGARALVWADGSDLHVISPMGTARIVTVQGLHSLGRPSLSPDGTKVAVQATATPFGDDPQPDFLSIYVINLADGAWQWLAPTTSDPFNGNELPEWLLKGNAIAYQSTETQGEVICDVVKITDATTREVKTTLRREGTSGCVQATGTQEAPRVHTAFTRDGKKVLLVGLLQTFDTTTGARLSDTRSQVLAGLKAAGYAPDDRYSSRAGLSAFPLDGAFSPDGSQIVFDGSVKKDGRYGMLVMRINADGSGFTILAGPLDATPQFSTGNVYSTVNPVWKS